MAKVKKSGSEKREREVLIGFRATATEVQEIDAAAKIAGLSRSAYVRAQSLSKPKTRRRPTMDAAPLARILGQLGKCGSNLNQIAHMLNRGDVVTHSAITATVGEVRDLTKEIFKAMGRRSHADSD